MTILKPYVRSGDEFGRQCALDRLHVLDTPEEQQFDKITSLVKTIFNVPVAAISLIDRRRQWFKSIQGLAVTETPREVAFCDHTIRLHECLHIPDALLDDRVRNNPLVTHDPFIRSYLGAPIITPDGYALGSLCAIDFEPRSFSEDQKRVLAKFADLVMNELELRQTASVDSLTGLATRRSFLEQLEIVTQKNEPAVLLYLDLDRFKSINDTYGHATGDAVLQAVSQVIMECCPETAFVGRIGGEELAVLLPGADTKAGANVAEKLRSSIESARAAIAPDLTFTASFGMALRMPGTDNQVWMAAADAALYAAKNGGRNCVRSSDPADNTGGQVYGNKGSSTLLSAIA